MGTGGLVSLRSSVQLVECTLQYLWITSMDTHCCIRSLLHVCIVFLVYSAVWWWYWECCESYSGRQCDVVKVIRHTELVVAIHLILLWTLDNSMQCFTHHGLRQACKAENKRKVTTFILVSSGRNVALNCQVFSRCAWSSKKGSGLLQTVCVVCHINYDFCLKYWLPFVSLRTLRS